ncbi:MAG TPA: acyl-CoA dehydrogenase family protein [Actinomycetota bacterium]|jgi:alkylation response protein AidB-like acyl-CoA dehydrogenase|nr:acyl-CoA dehydrogenase family protein [Actinomycetota bacterium]
MTTTTSVRDDVRAWLDGSWDPERPLAEWREILVESGWGCPSWPLEWHGRGLDRDSAAIVGDEFRKTGAVGPAIGVGMGLAAPTILDHGSDDLKARFLRPAATGEHKWCQLFSEPGSGSDLAGLSTHAERSGDEWIVNGQKVWNTGARTADYGLLMARTDWDVPKHRGISYFVLPMKQDGVEVRPIVQMNGYQSFNEVFISDARIPGENVVGDLNDGWRVGLTTLAYERVGIGNIFSSPSIDESSGRTAKEAAEEAAAYLQTYVWYPSRMGRTDLLIPHAKAAGRSTDPKIRQRIAFVESLVLMDRWTKQRAAAARRAGLAPGPEGSIAKIVLSRIAQAAAQTHAAIAGPSGLLTNSDGALDGTAAEITLSYPAQSIAGGTDEIQLNILAERVLGLPKEPQVDTEVPFRQVKRS